ncbi:restriction endonuclease subunit S [Vibrio parahaemolyticus]|uniref:restriction endonuclease subunit S n=3 Tax=Vibrio parahaemolyticus TaxID=670 RepID=UPI00111EB5A1|nr:restriction endonuclease subunit S [Vibrio parahaemolyticus]EGR2016754.1 restriction endonuclease subunit S [Vibrio cholerae]HDY7775877.1 restriction endonuclease subunit S [Vibrio vulnificus]EGR2444970.1 restriction endonuclease subunit S [Vibrio cholerae]EJB8351164.1 restriction endonuclease subunit S [Vibrio cholerae]EJB8380627.1 restriction endonuclease subunit S [Vibrio cholerae]
MIKITENWAIKEFGDIVSIKCSKFDPKSQNERRKCIELEHIEQQSGRIVGYTNTFESTSTKNVFSKGDVLFGKLRPYLRKFAQAPFDGVCSSEIWVFTPQKSIRNDFLYYLIQSDSFLDQANKSCGTKMPRADWKVVSKYNFLLPPLVEQQKIAEVLSTVDKKIDLIDQKIAETEKLKTGLMQKLFSEGIGVQDENGNWQPHTDFKSSGYPDCWKVMQLKSIAKVITGKTPPPANTENYGGDYMFVSPSDLGSRKYISYTKSTLSKQGVNNGKVVPKGAIFFTCIGSTIGKIGISTQECCTNQQINTVILEKDGYTSEYVYYALSHISESIKRLAGIQAVPIVKKSLFESQFIPIPPQEEQQVIAETLATVDLKLDILDKQKAETQQLKKGLMQKLLTGEWRVPVEETEAA